MQSANGRDRLAFSLGARRLSYPEHSVAGKFVVPGGAAVSTRSRHVRIAVTLLALLALAAPALDAQIVRLPRRSREPALWASVAGGYMQMGSVNDGRTQSVWAFGDGFQFRGSLEYAIGSGTTVGVVASTAHLPLRYLGSTAETADVDAHADVRTLHAGFHAGGGIGFHQVIQVGLGVTQFANLRSDQGSSDLEPSSDTDFSFALGYGFGFTMSSRLHVSVVQEYGSSIHQSEGLSNDTRRATNQFTTRLGVRVGAGARRTRI